MAFQSDATFAGFLRSTARTAFLAESAPAVNFLLEERLPAPREQTFLTEKPGSTPTGAGTTKTSAPGATPTPVSFATVDACSYTPRAEISTIPGLLAPTKMQISGWMAGQCAWSATKGGFIVAVGTAASIASVGNKAVSDAKALLAAFKTSTTGMTDVAGIGDGAVSGPIGVAAYKGSTYIQLTNLGLTTDQLTAVLKVAISHV